MDKRIGDQLPSLTTLVLTSNLVKEVGDLDGLSKCYGLTHLSLLENPVTKKEVSHILLTTVEAPTDVSVALQILPNMAHSLTSIPRFSARARGGAGAGERAVWYSG